MSRIPNTSLYYGNIFHFLILIGPDRDPVSFSAYLHSFFRAWSFILHLHFSSFFRPRKQNSQHDFTIFASFPMSIHIAILLTNYLTHLHIETGPAFILVFVLFDSDSLDIILFSVSLCLCASYYYIFVTLFSFLFSLFLAFILSDLLFEICNDSEID